MDRNIFGDWGAELNDTQYAYAIAALGTLEAIGSRQHTATSDPAILRDALREEFENGERTAIWRGAYNPRGTTETGWRDFIHRDAQALAQAWKLYVESAWHPRLMPRLAASAAWRRRPDLLDLDALFDLLAQADVQSLSLVPEDAHRRKPRAIWHWPVKVGVPAGSEGERLFDSFQAAAHSGSGWVGELAQVRKVGEVRDTSDLLILPPGWVERLAGQSSLRLRASFVVCLDEPTAWSRSAEPAVMELLHQIDASGIAFVGHPDRLDPGYWYREVIRELSHDLPLHAALWLAGPRSQVMPTILGFPDHLDRLRILAIAERLDRQWDTLRQDSVLESFQPSLAGNVRGGGFYHESEDGLPAAYAFTDSETQIEEQRLPRWIQADIAHAESETATADSLAPNQPNLVTVFIGPSDEERSDQPFPDRDFDYSDGPVPLEVLFQLENASLSTLDSALLDRPDYRLTTLDDIRRALQDYRDYYGAPEPPADNQPLIGLATQAISLPAVGNSTPARFVAWPQEGTSKATGRISIIHHNRIIQTAKFEAAVGIDETSEAKPRVEIEQVTFPLSSDLPERREFDLAMIVADDLGQGLRLTMFRKDNEESQEGNKESHSLGNITGEIEKIQDTIYKVTRREERVQNIAEDKTIELVLYSLAANGATIYNTLAHLYDGLVDDLDTDDEGRRVQVMTIGSSYFPLEYVYGGPSPKVGAKVCPNAVAALQHGSCGDCENQHSSAYVCPVHFWGWKHIIERHASAPRGDSDPRQMPLPTRTPFGDFTPILFAASERAFDFAGSDDEKHKLFSALEALGTLPGEEINDWDQWRTLVEKAPPNTKVLVLLPHTDTVEFTNAEVLEIGKEKQLGKNEIVEGILGPIGVPKLLILIGCTTADVTETFASYHGLFQMAGANIVISSLAQILGRDAVPIAREIANQLTARAAAGVEIALGELIRDVRRQLLAEGHSGVLGILSFGDADWTFGG